MNDTHCKISAATLARTAALALALTNQVLSACGKPMLPIESATVEQLAAPCGKDADDRHPVCRRHRPDRDRRPCELVEE